MFSYNRRRFLQALFTRRGSTNPAEAAGCQSRRNFSYTIYHGLLKRLFCLASSGRNYSRVKLDALCGLKEIRAAELSVPPPSDEVFRQFDEKSKRMVQIVRLEMEQLRGMGWLVPEQLSDARWKEVVGLEERNKRSRLYRFLKNCEDFNRVVAGERTQRRETVIRKKRERAERPYDELEYALDRNNIMPVLSYSELKLINDVRLCQAMIHGPRVVLDLGLTHLMDQLDSERCVKLISYMLGYNRYNREPFDVHLCNVQRDTWVHKALLDVYPNLHSKEILLNVTDKSYLELFPKERLVYLTPDAHWNLIKYRSDDVYIIGGLESRALLGPVTLAKAKKEGIRTARIKTGKLNQKESFCLRLDHTFRILLDLKNTGDLKKAMKHMPKPHNPEEQNEIYYK